MLMVLPKVGVDDTDLSLSCILGYHLHSQSGYEICAGSAIAVHGQDFGCPRAWCSADP